jgi:hypothetical protein
MKMKVRWVGFFSMHVRESSGFRVQVLKKNQEMDGIDRNLNFYVAFTV